MTSATPNIGKIKPDSVDGPFFVLRHNGHELVLKDAFEAQGAAILESHKRTIGEAYREYRTIALVPRIRCGCINQETFDVVANGRIMTGKTLAVKAARDAIRNAVSKQMSMLKRLDLIDVTSDKRLAATGGQGCGFPGDDAKVQNQLSDRAASDLRSCREGSETPADNSARSDHSFDEATADKMDSPHHVTTPNALMTNTIAVVSTDQPPSSPIVSVPSSPNRHCDPAVHIDDI
jgi:hypothetical protein